MTHWRLWAVGQEILEESNSLREILQAVEEHTFRSNFECLQILERQEAGDYKPVWTLVRHN